MKSINIDDGSIKLCINGDESRIISFNPNDVNFVQRFYELLNDFSTKEQELLDKAKLVDDNFSLDENGVPKNINAIFNFTKEIDEYFKERLDYVFGEGTSKACFGNINVMSVDNKGNRILFNFLNAITPFIKNAREKELDKYTGKYKSKGKK